MVSFITPPVALATFAAAPLAGASAMRIGVQSVRLGMAIYLVPFCFVLNPALLFKGGAGEVALAIGLAFAGIILAAAAMQGHVPALGRIPTHPAGWIARLALIAGGLLLAVPSPRLTGLSLGVNVAIAAVLVLAGVVLLWLMTNEQRQIRRKPA
jgi:TRAP-type uncharacterized transport system fused permease subunit